MRHQAFEQVPRVMVMVMVMVMVFVIGLSATTATAGGESDEDNLRTALKRYQSGTSRLKTDPKDQWAVKGDKQAVEFFTECLSLLDQVFKTNPKRLDEAMPGVLQDQPAWTGKQARAECEKGLAAANERVAKREKGGQDSVKQQLTNLGAADWRHGNDLLESARKKVKSSDRFAMIDANLLYNASFKSLKNFNKLAEDLVRMNPGAAGIEIAAGGQTMKAADMVAKSKELLDAGSSEAKGIADKVEKATAAWNKAFTSEMGGERGRIAKSRGVPSDWDGANVNSASERLANAKKAGSWRYEESGCVTEYLWKGNQLANTHKNCR